MLLPLSANDQSSLSFHAREKEWKHCQYQQWQWKLPRSLHPDLFRHQVSEQ